MRDFTKDRLTVEPGRNFFSGAEQLGGLRSPAPRDATGDVLRPSEADDFARQLAARWNAVADALAYLEALKHRTGEELDVMVILRRAVHGEPEETP